MPSVISSEAIPGHVQSDGRRYVREYHAWDDGSATELEYGPVADKLDYQAIADDRAARMTAERAEVEQHKSERAAAEAKVASVIDAAIKAGTITEEDARKAGASVPAQEVGDVGAEAIEALP